MKLKTLKDLQKHEIPGYPDAPCIFVSKLEAMIKNHIEYLKQPTEEYERDPYTPSFREIHDIQIECLQHIFNTEPIPEPKTIQFAHHYFKLHDIDSSEPVTLIQVIPMHGVGLSDEFIHYDTLYYKDQQPKHYQFTNVDNIIILIFEQDGKIFTSIRKTTSSNIDKYTTSIGCDFKIEYM